MDRRIGASVFAKLVAIMLAMAVALLALIVAFFAWVVNPVVTTSVARLVEDHVAAFSATGPGLAAGRAFHERTGIHVRYEGPKETWATTEWLPTVAEARQRQQRLFGGRGYYLAPAPDGGTYLFLWTYGRQMVHAHNVLLVLLVALMITIVVVTYISLRRLLRPLRTLGDGVARLGEGQLDVEVPNRTRDEFGALTDAFNTMARRVREMIRARDQLLLDVSHELRSPLTRLRVNLALLPDDRNRAGMTADVEEMEAMIAELLELERLRDGRGLRTERQDLMPILRDVARGCVIEGPPQLFVEIDGEKMRTVLRNLIENARKYGAPPITVTVTADATIRIHDEGPGIPPEDLPNLFEPFFRVNRSRAKTPAGYGLGLSMCKRIIEAHGGTIDVESGPGTTFVVRLSGLR